jgi:hypothetical protein
MASGCTVTSWAKANHVGRSTAFGWSRSPGFRDLVEGYRNKYLDRATGLLAKNTVKAALEINRLAGAAESESVRLNAARAVLSDVMALKTQDLARRVDEMEAQLRERARPGKKDRKA